MLGVRRPRVALLSVGEEQKKGRADVVEAHEALTGAEGIRFIGNVEGRDLLAGEADVIVTDGFTGNVTLKTLEGTARAVADAVRAAARSGPAGLGRRPAAAPGPRRPAPRAWTRTPSAGRSCSACAGSPWSPTAAPRPEGIANAVRLADRAVRERAVERTAELLAAAGATRDALREEALRRSSGATR